ncbi:MAG: hypothetical protein M3445_11740 [Actinomycetota bacterium]|nr:hypothetical protein [Actinomycetota bacterium]
MEANAIGGLLTLAGTTALIAAAIGVVLYWRSLRDLAFGLVRKVLPPAPALPDPFGPPIEQIAADARRIRAELMAAPPGLPTARLRGWRQAYDDVLASGCCALELDNRLDLLPPGPERDAERERVERLLERSGLRIHSAA